MHSSLFRVKMDVAAQKSFVRSGLLAGGAEGTREHRHMATTIKKYSNRRLYDTDESRYITLEELTDRIKRGTDVRVVDAKTGEDLTQATLVQIVLETPAAKLMPVALLSRMIRMQDDALGEFFSRYVTAALELYLAAKQSAQAASPYFPLATLPFSAGNALARAMGGLPFWGGDQGYAPPYAQAPYVPPQAAAAPPPPPPPTPVPAAPDPQLAALRDELEELKKELRSKRGKRA
jgi:polyhydroxyalkanoate synthesis repressor PhaR